MTRFTLICAALLWAAACYAQNCDTLICNNGQGYQFQPIEEGPCIWPVPVTDLIDYPASGCQDSLAAAIYLAPYVESQQGNFVPDFSGARDTLWVTEMDDPTSVVYVYLQFPDGDVQFCESYALLSWVDESSGCYTLGDPLGGLITTPEGAPIANVMVEQLSEIDTFNAVTNAAGTYLLNSNTSAYYPYTITPSRDADHSNGVSVFDLVLIVNHIMGVQPIEDPYQLIAADVNRSESISIADVVRIRKMTLGIIDSFSGNTSWRFVPASYEFPNPLNPWQEVFPETVEFSFTPETAIDVDFIGIKTGDVSGSADTN